MSNENLSQLALNAARELDQRSAGSTEMVHSHALADALTSAFSQEEELLHRSVPLESIGLVCTVLEDYGEGASRDGEEVESIAISAAKLLRKQNLSTSEVSRLVGLCISLYYAARERQEIHDFPVTHPELVTLS